MEKSDDGSKYTGGLISDISVDSSLVDSFKDWALDSSRKAGDTDVVDSTYGSHVMYFVGTGLPVWKASVVSTLRSDDVNQWTNSLVENADAQQLNTEEVEAAAVKHALFRGYTGGEETGEDGAQGAADAVNGDGAHRIVDLGHLIEELHSQHDDQAENNAHNGGT